MTASAIPVPGLSEAAPTEPVLGPAPETERPKRTRQRKEEPLPEPAGPSPEDLANAQAAMAVTFKAAAALAASKWGEHWLLAEPEAKQVGDAWGTAVAPYLSKIGPATPFLVAAMVTWSVVQPRIAETKRRQALKGPMTDEPAVIEDSKGRAAAVVVVPQAEPPRR